MERRGNRRGRALTQHDEEQKEEVAERRWREILIDATRNLPITLYQLSEEEIHFKELCEHGYLSPPDCTFQYYVANNEIRLRALLERFNVYKGQDPQTTRMIHFGDLNGKRSFRTFHGLWWAMFAFAKQRLGLDVSPLLGAFRDAVFENMHNPGFFTAREKYCAMYPTVDEDIPEMSDTQIGTAHTLMTYLEVLSKVADSTKTGDDMEMLARNTAELRVSDGQDDIGPVKRMEQRIADMRVGKTTVTTTPHLGNLPKGMSRHGRKMALRALRAAYAEKVVANAGASLELRGSNNPVNSFFRQSMSIIALEDALYLDGWKGTNFSLYMS
ncbi:hypothetical protein BU16DRAFT_612464 [Lophium mytilinum]|uniref:Uncharacterized protein n=1 Tax=Lophium mytilinum TaxID=390894 RepID=A0A6A6RE78_9PEZI|nr:hypothetical protein BU16DRAFT_612464 [Lophium mytilinum]